ncbi:MAG: DUF5685 family protein [Eubacteriales bacterium]|nr:DUF5685 family protein [Eubacteriales bacterium]
MFGYVKPYKPELKMLDYSIYRAAYCGLCHAIESDYGQLPRSGLSYDLCFLALLLEDRSQADSELELGRCWKRIGKKNPHLVGSRSMAFVATLSVLLSSAKFQDNLSDGDKRIASGFGKLLFSRACKRARRRAPGLSKWIELVLAHEAQAAVYDMNREMADYQSYALAVFNSRVDAFSEGETRTDIVLKPLDDERAYARRFADLLDRLEFDLAACPEIDEAFRQRIFRLWRSHLLPDREACLYPMVAQLFSFLMSGVILFSFEAELEIPRQEENALLLMVLELARWIYLIDAIDDYEEDHKLGRQNPFAALETQADVNNLALIPCLRSEAKVFEYFDLLSPWEHSALIANIISDGLLHERLRVMNRQEATKI